MSLAKSGSLRQMATLQAVARLGSVSAAAQELHLSQSAVSMQIAGLEAAVGAPLLVRTGHGVKLTKAGELLRAYADRLLVLWHEASDEMATHLGDFSGTLRIGAVSTAEYWLPRLLVAFADLNPRVKFKLQVGNRDEIVRSLGSQEIHIAVMGLPPAELVVRAAPFAKNPMAFVASPSLPLMANTPLRLEDVALAPLLVRERGSGSRLTLERLFKEAGLRPRIGAELSSNEAIKQMCVAGYGPAFVSLPTCALEIEAGLLALMPLPGNPVEREWYAVSLAAAPLPQVAEAFEHFLVANGQRSIEQRGAERRATSIV